MAHNHAELLNHIKADMPADELLQDLGDLFKVFGDTTRIKIMYALYEDEMCVCAIAELIGMTQSAVSHQLKALKAARLQKPRQTAWPTTRRPSTHITANTIWHKFPSLKTR